MKKLTKAWSGIKVDWNNQLVNLLVVFIGISAGFFLQNRKESKVENQNEVKYIKSLIYDIEENQNELARVIEGDSLDYESGLAKLILMAKDSLTLDSANSFVTRLSSFHSFTPRKETYQNMVNSGSIGIISSFEPRQEVVSYYTSLEDHMLIEEYFQHYHSEMFMPFILENYDIIKQELASEDLVGSAELRNICAISVSFTSQRLEAYKVLLENAKEVKRNLEDYVDSL